jgi:hypothetical protein
MNKRKKTDENCMNKRKEDDEKGREDERIHEKRLDYKVTL